MIRPILLFFSIQILFLFSCEQPQDQVIEAVNHTNDVLIKNTWYLNEFTINVKEPDIPPPILFNSSDALTREGEYNLEDMVLDVSDFQQYQVQFTSDRKIITGNSEIDILGDSVGTYFVFNERQIRITSAEALTYRYHYDNRQKTLKLLLNDEDVQGLVDDLNEELIDKISGNTPGKIGDLVASLLFNNESIQKLINDVLVSAISGKLSFINRIDPEDAAMLLSKEIIEIIKGINWESELKTLLQLELEKINDIDAEALSEVISAEIADFINGKITIEGIYDLVFPYIEEIPSNSDEVAKAISTLMVNLILEIFDEDFLKTKISESWVKFTELNSEKVGIVADTLTAIVENVWINQENVKAAVYPFIEKIEGTSILQMGQLADETVGAIKVIVDDLNLLFPDLNLTPDYESMQSIIKALFIAAKPTIGLAGGADQVANELSQLIIDDFLNSDNIKKAFTTGINFLQAIDAELAGSTIAGWIVSLEGEIAPVVIEYLSKILSPILDNINPELTAFKIARALKGFVTDNITKENLQALIQPVLQAITSVNAEAVATFLAKKILALDIIGETINEENINAILLPILVDVQQSNVEELAQNLITAIYQSGLFEDTITESRVSTIISLLIYKSAWDQVRIANNFQDATIILRHE
ncbi:hypothetical protein [Reichenbachiella ulvae]|uniref:Uncharacterized protein n=1 Tax=Reichenbachiella ulvae TaxID=2980104 RepID=A0ABT3CRP7_9BACT|nr:hypothetical protein [Reichenbachiella ulvae]MCV9386297.1 hypothetical protein [Reichenbachiella ulvae]